MGTSYRHGKDAPRMAFSAAVNCCSTFALALWTMNAFAVPPALAMESSADVPDCTSLGANTPMANVLTLGLPEAPADATCAIAWTNCASVGFRTLLGPH